MSFFDLSGLAGVTYIDIDTDSSKKKRKNEYMDISLVDKNHVADLHNHSNSLAVAFGAGTLLWAKACIIVFGIALVAGAALPVAIGLAGACLGVYGIVATGKVLRERYKENQQAAIKNTMSTTTKWLSTSTKNKEETSSSQKLNGLLEKRPSLTTLKAARDTRKGEVQEKETPQGTRHKISIV